MLTNNIKNQPQRMFGEGEGRGMLQAPIQIGSLSPHPQQSSNLHNIIMKIRCIQS